eukprot:CAMPEP_0175065272 /NCGR_PEP_ID=MMETSP0052_2-20121109/15825_1 /TAXON_ID=51329 ORGANISM="Polytomella parva, Strain SAG 63-3" /NCGR_SAMPLE_ID=MMETSP0052_2 /ASSEMBLY_ACC=CAM_ASM_000194 /LENGTH=73 /DNA_ID=CAMNT_0016331773 /DNA_START=176 /DNA_END=393 /DNA_ORIENTATION=-
MAYADGDETGAEGSFGFGDSDGRIGSNKLDSNANPDLNIEYNLNVFNGNTGNIGNINNINSVGNTTTTTTTTT